MRGILTAFALATLLSVGNAATDTASHSDDPEQIAALAAALVSGEWEEAEAARDSLRSDYGAYAVNGLLRYIGGSSDVEERVSAIYTLRRLGDEATLALLAALHSDDAVLRRNICQVLRATGDTRAVATLTALAEHDDNALVRAEAAAAAMSLGASAGSGVDRLVGFAKELMSGGSSDDDGDGRVFFWNGRGVGNADVTAEMEPYAYARLFAEDAVRIDPSNVEAQSALVDAYDGLRAAIGDDEERAEMAARIDDLLLLGGSGPELEAVPEFDPSSVEGEPGSLTSGEKRLRYLAALKSGAASADVVGTLGHALSESAIRHVLVVDNNVEALNDLVGSLRSRDTFATGASTGAQGLIRAKEAPIKDAIILRSTLDDIDVKQLVSSLGRDYRSQDTPIIVIANEHERVDLEVELGDRVVAVVAAPANAAVVQPVLDSAFDRMALNDQRLDAVAFSRHAANALAAMDGSVLGPAGDALVGAIGREDAVQIPAMRALGKLGAAAGQVPAAELLANEEASTEARVAAGIALAGILANHDALPATLAALRDALAGDDAELKTVAARALGTARSISAEQRSELLLDNRLEH